MKEITSSQNSLLKECRKLLSRKYRLKNKQYLLEGKHLVAEACQAEITLPYIFIDDLQLASLPWLKNYQQSLILLPRGLLIGLTEVESPQGIVAVAAMEETLPPARWSGRWLLLDRVQDPGNVGTMIRTADAAGFAGVVLGKGSADRYSPKVLRALQGSQYHLPVLNGDLTELLGKMAVTLLIFGTNLDKQALDIRQAPRAADLALIVGNEGQGVSKELLEQTDHNLYIPIIGKAESLNVGVAAGILMYYFALFDS